MNIAKILSIANETLRIGGRIFTDLDNLIQILAIADTTNYTTFRNCSTGAAYQVPGDSTLYLLAARIYVCADACGSSILYGDTAVSNTIAPTNPVHHGGFAAANTNLVYLNDVADGGQLKEPVELAIDFRVPAEKYPCFFANGGIRQSCTVFGYLKLN
jgi:hypothetical protein